MDTYKFEIVSELRAFHLSNGNVRYIYCVECHMLGRPQYNANNRTRADAHSSLCTVQVYQL